ncbi:hypothetical protein V9T40_012666 [Parthenolecanium corni]|uniref:Uncharacterized protein n=1 Tax=Parthenolecanium corni TaxID=536013 RepID=A0AAN9T859_9HEMI
MYVGRQSFESVCRSVRSWKSSHLPSTVPANRSLNLVVGRDGARCGRGIIVTGEMFTEIPSGSIGNTLSEETKRVMKREVEKGETERNIGTWEKSEDVKKQKKEENGEEKDVEDEELVEGEEDEDEELGEDEEELDEGEGEAEEEEEDDEVDAEADGVEDEEDDA